MGKNFGIKFRSVWVYLNQHISVKEIFIFLCFFAFASLMWIGRAMRTVRDKTITVPVEYIGIPKHIHCVGLPQQLTLTVRDIGTRLMTYDAQPLMPIQFDLSNQIFNTNGTITIPVEQIRSQVNDRLIGTTKLQRITPEFIQGSYSSQNEKDVPVVLNAKIIPEPQYQLIGSITVTPERIKIYGAKRAIDTIESIQTIWQDFPNTKDTFSYTLRLKPIQGVRLSDTIVKINGVAAAFTEKSFSLPITVVNVPSKRILRVFPPRANIKVRVAMAHFQEISENDFQVLCDYPAEPCDALPIEVTTSNPYVLDIRVTPQEVEYLIENK